MNRRYRVLKLVGGLLTVGGVLLGGYGILAVISNGYGYVQILAAYTSYLITALVLFAIGQAIELLLDVAERTERAERDNAEMIRLLNVIAQEQIDFRAAAFGQPPQQP